MKNNILIGWLGFGIFFWMTLLGIESLVSSISKELLLFIDLSPLLIFGLAEYGTLIVVFVLYLYVLKKIRHIDFNKPLIIKRLFIISIISFASTQVLGFAQSIILGLFQNDDYFLLKEAYYNSLNEYNTLIVFAIETPVFLLKYSVIAFLVFKNLKLSTS